jgi:hypothetical protein
MVYLDAVYPCCRGNTVLRRRVNTLLCSHGEVGSNNFVFEAVFHLVRIEVLPYTLTS